MGPPSEDGGNQEGTGLDFERHKLQWGRRPKTAEMAYVPQDRQGHLAASMGPPSEDGGNVNNDAVALAVANASMGPPSEDGGNLRSEPGLIWGLAMLQWGRRPKTAEMRFR